MTRMPREPLAACAVAALVIALAGCAGRAGATHAAPTGRVGTLHGRILGVGGPAPGTGQLLPGTVRVTSRGHVVYWQRVAQGTGFRLTVSAGNYRLSVVGRGRACQSRDVTVVAGSDRAVDLVCPLK